MHDTETTSKATLSQNSVLTAGALRKSGKFSVKKRGLFEQAKLASFRALGKRERFLVEDVQTAALLLILFFEL
ncbi:MAG: hypothetical protein IJR56_09805 [Bacteroidaceae bacterium]|nr:hypothetical protein [Bacteroidaceae bacterium]MBQ9884744.1 hypothetical protein [Bacteroidaceae bacterium]